MILFTLDEIELLLTALETWEDQAEQEFMFQEAQRNAQIMTEETLSGVPDEEREAISDQLARSSLAQYTPEMVKKLARERNEDSTLLRAKLIVRKREIEKRMADGVVEEVVKGLFGKEESDV